MFCFREVIFPNRRNKMDDMVSNNFTNDTFLGKGEDGLDTNDMDNCPPGKEDTAVDRAAKITALSLIMFTSFVGNILVICVTRRTRSLRKIAYTFVINMAIADALTTIINMPESLVIEIRDTDEWLSGNLGMVLCKLLPFCQQVCAYCSVLSLLAISLDRFFAICFPLRRFMSKRLSKVIIFFTWLIPVISSAPMFVTNKLVTDEGIVLCVEEWPAPFDADNAPTDYTIILFVLFYLVPFIIMSSFYSCVIYKIWRRKAPGNRSSTACRVYSQSRQKALKMFMTIVACFALCWLPYHVTFFLTSYNEMLLNCGLPRDIYFIAIFFTHAISAINPCIYMIFNKEYRTGSKRLFASCFCRHPSALYPKTSAAGRFANTSQRSATNEDHEMTSFHPRSPKFNFRSIWGRKVEPCDQDLPKNDVFVVHYIQRLTDRDEA